MCEQCSTDAVFYARNADGKEEVFLPGVALMRAQKNGDIMKKDQFGLVRCNDPDLVWTVTIPRDPYDGLSDPEINASKKDQEHDAFIQAVHQWRREICEFTVETEGPLLDTMYELVQAGIKAGYNRDKDGLFDYWICARIGQWLTSHQPVLHTEIGAREGPVPPGAETETA